MSDTGYIKLTREVEAIQIPSGNKITLPAGAEVHITQALGGTFTVHVVAQAGLFRIDGKDGDSLGREALVETVSNDGPFNVDEVWAQLRNCYDPEIPVNIVDLGLVYSLDVADEDKGKGINVKMTLTAPGCGMGPSIAADAERRVLTVPGVASATVEVVWEPPWSPDFISPAGRAKLGME